MSESINRKVTTATKWSALTELIAKLVTPISTMVLARLLTPEAFGVLVTATMVVSFAQIFTDAGFQKYIVQKEFASDDELYKSTSVAFWSNLIMSCVIWLVIILFDSQIAHWVGNDGYGIVISVSCICIPLAAFSSMQMALFRRKFDFRTLFWVRVVGIFIPLVITIPLAFITHSYWSLIIGMIALEASNAILLTLKSQWKPRWYYDWYMFKQMFSFTFWSMVEAVSIWLTNYLDVFIVGTVLSTYYMGIYRTSISTVGQLIALITAATTPILFSALSRLQDDREEFKVLFLKFQKVVGLFVIPLGAGIYLFSDLITRLLLGNQWMEASQFIGLWGLTSSAAVVLSHYSSEVYRSLGKPRLSVLSQWLHIIVLIPVVLYAIQYGFSTLVVARSLVRLEAIAVNLVLLYYIVKITPSAMLTNLRNSIIASIVMVTLAQFMPIGRTVMLDIACVVACCSVYFVVILLCPTERALLLNLKQILRRK